MSKGYEERNITLFFSPTELRNIASKMERRWREIRPGQSAVVDCVSVNQGLVVSIAMDQDKMTKDYGNPGALIDIGGMS